MGKLARVVLAFGVALAFAACAQKASKEDCTAACKKLVQFSQAAEPRAAAPDAAAVEKEFSDKLQQLNQVKEAALAALDKELSEKLAAVKEMPAKKGKKVIPDKKAEAAKQKLNNDYAAKKEAKAKEFDGKLAELTKAKGEAVSQAKAAAEQAAAAAKEAREKALAGCVDACLKAELTKDVTDCQQKAAKLEDYNKCAKK